MKLFNKIKNNKNSFVLLLITTLFISCNKDYLDVDTDTDNPTVAPLNLLLTNTQVSLKNINDFNNYTGSLLSVYTHQTCAREEQDQYGIRVDNINMSNDWNAIYLNLNDLQTLITQATKSGDMVYVGIAQMEKAFLMSVAVDLWGDVPYTEATKLKDNIISPKFDDQKAIYADIFALIKSAKANIASNAGLLKPAADDLFYGGDRAKWIRFANSFQLKLYNQVRLTTAFDQAGFDALVAENNFFTSLADDFQFDHTAKLSPSDERNSYFLESYNSTQFSTYQSPWFYEILKGMNPKIHSGIPDPRLPYYFFNQIKPGANPPDYDSATGNPNADYWDKSTGFYSIRFGSTGPNRDKSQETSYTYPGIFPTGGRYDDGKGFNLSNLSAGSGTGVAPHRIFTYAEFLYVQAELMQVGKLSGNITTKLQDAITASFAKVDQVVAKSGSPQLATIPVLTGSAAVTTFTSRIMSEFAAAAADKKLEIIMTQKWVATYGDPMDQYTDYRRTGYPVLANPLSLTKEYQLNNGDAFPINDAQTVQNNPFQQSFFWPQDELNSNQNAPAQKNPGTYKIFWAK